MANATTSNRHPVKRFELEVTIISAKHLKNVNWRTGNLNPYVIFWLNPRICHATKSDDSNSTKPVWNERFTFPITPSAILTFEICHAKPYTPCKPLVGTLRIAVRDLHDLENPNMVRTFDLRRPSGRLQGKIRLKFVLRERVLHEYQNTVNTPQVPFNYNIPRPMGPLSPYGSYASLPVDAVPYSGYHQVGGGAGRYYSRPVAASPPRAMKRRFSYVGGGGGPSAPLE